MSKNTVPPQVKDEDKRTKVFDWRVPISAGGQRAALTGALFWQPADASGIPFAAIVALVVLVIVTIALFVVTRRRRAAAAGKPRQAW
jgi:ABC-type spermidine/putrescine transport system permease subunit I